jgi:hypothetical protein
MVLLDHVVHVFQGSKLRLSCRTMRGCVAIQRNRLRGAALAFDRFLEEGLGCSDISLGAESEVYGLASPMHHPCGDRPSGHESSDFVLSGRARLLSTTLPTPDSRHQWPAIPSCYRAVAIITTNMHWLASSRRTPKCMPTTYRTSAPCTSVQLSFRRLMVEADNPTPRSGGCLTVIIM